MIKGLFGTHLFVADIERSIEFYGKVLGLKQCHYEDERRVAFFWIGQEKQSMLGLLEKPKESIDIGHFAFETDPDWIINASITYLKKRKITFWNFLRDDTERPMIYFLGFLRLQFILVTQTDTVLSLSEF